MASFSNWRRCHRTKDFCRSTSHMFGWLMNLYNFNHSQKYMQYIYIYIYTCNMQYINIHIHIIHLLCIMCIHIEKYKCLRVCIQYGYIIHDMFVCIYIYLYIYIYIYHAYIYIMVNSNHFCIKHQLVKNWTPVFYHSLGNCQYLVGSMSNRGYG